MGERSTMGTKAFKSRRVSLMYHLKRHLETIRETRDFLVDENTDYETQVDLTERLYDAITDMEDYVMTKEAQKNDAF
jgi:hypothetical protein